MQKQLIVGYDNNTNFTPFVIGVIANDKQMTFYGFWIEEQSTCYKELKTFNLDELRGRMQATAFMWNLTEWIKPKVEGLKLKNIQRSALEKIVQKLSSMSQKEPSKKSGGASKPQESNQNSKFTKNETVEKISQELESLGYSQIQIRNQGVLCDETSTHSEGIYFEGRTLLFLARKEKEQFAIKVIKNEEDEEECQETNILQHLNSKDLIQHPHNHTIHLFDKQVRSIRKKKNIAIFMEKIDHQNPKNLIEFKNYSIQLISFLSFLHSHGIAHCDIKPDNILFDSKKNQIKVIDFGLSLFFEKNQIFTHLRGTEGYMAPEVENHEPHLKDLSDIYSLGKTLSKILTKTNLKLNHPDLYESYLDLFENIFCHLNPKQRPSAQDCLNLFNFVENSFILRPNTKISTKPISLVNGSTYCSPPLVLTQ